MLLFDSTYKQRSFFSLFTFNCSPEKKKRKKKLLLHCNLHNTSYWTPCDVQYITFSTPYIQYTVSHITYINQLSALKLGYHQHDHSLPWPYGVQNKWGRLQRWQMTLHCVVMAIREALQQFLEQLCALCAASRRAAFISTLSTAHPAPHSGVRAKHHTALSWRSWQANTELIRTQNLLKNTDLERERQLQR